MEPSVQISKEFYSLVSILNKNTKKNQLKYKYFSSCFWQSCTWTKPRTRTMAQLQPLHRGHSTRAPADLQKRSKEGREVHFKIYVGARSLPSHKADNPWKPWGNGGNRSSAPPLEQKDAYSVVIYFSLLFPLLLFFCIF